MAEGGNEVWTPAKLNKLLATNGGIMMLPSRSCDEVVPGIYVAEGEVATNPAMLQKLGVTHVVNTCQGDDRWTQVDTSAETYAERGLKFFGFPGVDKPSYNISRWFHSAADFMQEALDSKGRVLVHCVAGASRSATIVIAYLMVKRGLTVAEAVRVVRAKREIAPNNGFLKQLCDLQESLRTSGLAFQSLDH